VIVVVDVDVDDDIVVVPNETTSCVPLLPSALQRHSKVAATMITMSKNMARRAAAL